jgi:ArsR family transcriptional regulator
MEDDRIVRVLKALGDPKRFAMVLEIAAAGELSCGQVGQRFKLSQPAISHHLKLLIAAGVVTTRSAGQHHFISVDAEALASAFARLTARLEPRRAKRARGG